MAKAKQAEAEAEAPDAEGGDGAKGGGFLSRKLIVMAAAGLLVLGGGGAGAYFFLFSKKPHDEKPVAVAKAPPAFYDLPELMVNLQSPGNGRSSYLKARIVLELDDQKLDQRFHGSNHIRRPRRVCRTRCG